MKERRRKIVRERKNFLPSLLLTITLWLALAGLIYLVDPDVLGIVIIFFLILFLALTFSFALMLANTKRGIIIATAATLFLVLRYFGVGNLLNGLLIIGVAIAIAFIV